MASLRVVAVRGQLVSPPVTAESSTSPLSFFIHQSYPALPPQLPAHPVFSELRVCIPNGVTGPQPNPLRDRAVLLLRFRELDFGTERLLALQVGKQHRQLSILRKFRAQGSVRRAIDGARVEFKRTGIVTCGVGCAVAGRVGFGVRDFW